MSMLIRLLRAVHAAIGAVGDDGKPLRYFNDVADAHEFGHARGFLLMRYAEAKQSRRWWQLGRMEALQDANKGSWLPQKTWLVSAG
jgi:hypothetical protein